MSAHNSGAPAGWKLVPIEPTERMICAGIEAYQGKSEESYAAMVAAAPAAPVAQAVPVAGEWMPIETAPKDGNPVLLYLPAPWGRIEIAYWFAHWENWQCLGDKPNTVRDEYCGIGSELPTHWMPLPPAPGSAK